MKTYLIILLMTLSVLHDIKAQWTSFNDTFNFSQGWPAYFSPDTTQSNNLWQVGTPSKTNFNAAYSPPYALMTDTMYPFPSENTSSFTISLNLDTIAQWMCIGEGYLTYRHAYDFDSLRAGGYLEMRYYDVITEQWTPWHHVTDDPYCMMHSPDPDHFPSDTITGGIPAYTGCSFGWQSAQYWWLWMVLVKGEQGCIITDFVEIRFTALSDSSAIPSEGWIIDDLELMLLPCVGPVNEPEASTFHSKPIPNPGSGEIRILTGSDLLEEATVQVFTREGMLAGSVTVQAGEPILLNSHKLPAGYYLYRIITSSGKVSQGQFVKLSL